MISVNTKLVLRKTLQAPNIAWKLFFKGTDSNKEKKSHIVTMCFVHGKGLENQMALRECDLFGIRFA